MARAVRCRTRRGDPISAAKHLDVAAPPLVMTECRRASQRIVGPQILLAIDPPDAFGLPNRIEYGLHSLRVLRQLQVDAFVEVDVVVDYARPIWTRAQCAHQRRVDGPAHRGSVDAARIEPLRLDAL